MTQNEIAREILKILIEYDNASYTVRRLGRLPTFLDARATASVFQLSSNEMEGIEFLVLQERLDISLESLKNLIIKLLKYGAITCFAKITPSNFSLDSTSPFSSLPFLNASTVSFHSPSPNDILIAITNEGRKIYNNNQKLNALFPLEITTTETKEETEEEIKTTKPKRLTFKEKEPAFYYGDDKCKIPLHTSRTADLSYEFLICKFLYTKNNKKKTSFSWDEVYDYIIQETQGEKIDDNYRANKIIKRIKDTIIRVNKKTESDFGFKILQIKRGVIMKLK